MNRITAPVNAGSAMGIAGFTTDYTPVQQGWKKGLFHFDD
jgi:hypothetical protein